MFVQNTGGPSDLGIPVYGFANALLFDVSDKIGASDDFTLRISFNYTFTPSRRRSP